MRRRKLFGAEEPGPRPRPHKDKNQSKDPDGLRPGDRYSAATKRAYERLADLGGDRKDPRAWQQVALSLRRSDPRAASCAFHIGSRVAGSAREWELGQHLAQASTDIECSFHWTRGLDLSYRAKNDERRY